MAPSESRFSNNYLYSIQGDRGRGGRRAGKRKRQTDRENCKRD
jgi:hypothetical protein